MRSRLEKTFVLLTILFCCAVFTNGAPGDLDLTFNGTGKVTTVVSSGNPATNVLGAGIAIQADGKTVMTGLCLNGTNNDFCLVRYNTDGSLDTSFGVAGKVLRPIGTRFDNSLKLAIQPDGKIVVVGTYQFNPANFDFIGVVARFNSNGSLDTTFSSVGFRFVTMEIATSLAIQLDGKIVIAGYTQATARAIVQRVNADGSNDGTFGNSGTSGYIEITFAVGRTDIFNSITVQTDGKIVVAGSSASGTPQFAVARLTTAGLLDTSFDTDGLVITPINATARSVSVQPDGKIVAAGGTTLIRYNPNGSLDTSFDADGIVVAGIGSFSASLQPNGKIVLGGASGTDFGLARYNVNGSLDTAFGSGGLLTIDFGSTTETGYSTALDSSGRILIGGISNNLFAVARVLGDEATTPFRSRADFDGDGRTDLSVFRPSEGNWYLNRSTAGFAVINWGMASDTIVPGDYDGDNKADEAIFRPAADSAQSDYLILRSNGFVFQGVSWGLPGDVSVSGDYDNDGRTDLAVFRPSTSTWYILNSSGSPANTVERFGSTGDIPLAIDDDGDGKTNLAVFRPSENTWYIAKPTGSPATNFNAYPFGLAGDQLVQADYDGDNKEDIAVFRPSNGTWYIRGTLTGTTTFTAFGTSGDIAVPGDYDGDGKDDIAVYRAGTWYLLRSTAGSIVQTFGTGSDIPVPKRYLPPA